MKKVLYFISIISLFVLTGCSKSNLKTLSLDELYNKLENKDSFVLYIELGDSSLKNKLEKVLDSNNLTGYYINAGKISNDDKLKLEPKINYNNSEIVFVVEGKDPAQLSHVTNDNTTIKEIEARLKDMKFIKEIEE